MIPDPRLPVSPSREWPRPYSRTSTPGDDCPACRALADALAANRDAIAHREATRTAVERAAARVNVAHGLGQVAP
jgi:hypothetical protein